MMTTDDLGTLFGIAIALAVGALLSLGGLVIVARSKGLPVKWERLALGFGIALAINAIGLVLSVVFRPDGSPRPPEWFLNAVGFLVVPGMAIWAAMMFLAPRSLQSVSLLFFGGYALNMAIWLVVAYLVIARRVTAGSPS